MAGRKAHPRRSEPALAFTSGARRFRSGLPFRSRRSRAAQARSVMLILRSLAFNLAYYLNLIVWMIAFLPILALPRRVFMRVARLWARSSL